MIFKISPMSSCGLMLSYQCSNNCQHCLYACSPQWKEWISKEDLIPVLESIRENSRYLTGIHIAGGEPFLNPDLLQFAIEETVKRDIPIDYVETNAFWAWEDSKTEAMLTRMKEAGLHSLLVSVSPFHLEFIPMERTERAIRIGQKVFGPNHVLIYTRFFYEQFQELDGTLEIPFEDYVQAIGPEEAAMVIASEYSLIPNGRTATKLAPLFNKRPAASFFGETCKKELSNPHHAHIDCYGNYIAGLCAGISLGDGKNLSELYNGIDLSQKPILRRLVEGGVESLYSWAVEAYGFRQEEEGYIAKCHLCLDIRRFLVEQGHSSTELAPRPFYDNLEE